MGTKINDTAFASQGFIVASLDVKSELQAIRNDILKVFNAVRMGDSSKPVREDKDVINFHHENQKMQYHALKLCWGLPSLLAIGNHPHILAALKELGLRSPLMALPPQLRCDMPVEKQSIFHQHQDYTYNLGSKNSVTVWIPLSDVDIDKGALQVASGSHRKGIYPHKSGIINERLSFDFASQPMKFGEALIFDQKLVHASGKNKSQSIRFSIQIRYSDMECEDFAARGWPINHSITTDTFAEPTVSVA